MQGDCPSHESRELLSAVTGGAVLPPWACSSARRVTQAPRCEAQLLHHISNTLTHKYVLTKFLTSHCEQTRSPLLVPPALRRVTRGVCDAASTALWPTPCQPRSHCSCFACWERGLKGFALSLWLIYTLIRHTSDSFHLLCIGVSSQAGVPGVSGGVIHQPRLGTTLVETGGYSLGKGDDGGGGRGAAGIFK